MTASNLALVASNDNQAPAALTPTIDNLNQRIAALELERSQLPGQDPHAIEMEIQATAARAIVDPDRFKPVLESLINAKDAALRYQARRIAIDNELRHLRIERDGEVANEERYRLEDARKEFQAAYDEFVASARQMCRAYQRAYRIDRKHASRTPRYGAHTMPAFNIALPAFAPYGWNGSTSQYVMDGSLPWLKEQQS